MIVRALVVSPIVVPFIVHVVRGFVRGSKTSIK